MAIVKAPYHPIIYVRGFAITRSESTRPLQIRSAASILDQPSSGLFQTGSECPVNMCLNHQWYGSYDSTVTEMSMRMDTISLTPSEK